MGQAWEEARSLAHALKRTERLDELALGVANLERRYQEARKRLEIETSGAVETFSEAVDSDPKGSENRPHQYNYKSNLNPQEDTVMAFEGCSEGAAAAVSSPAPAVPHQNPRPSPTHPR